MEFNSIAIASDHRGYWLKKDIIDYFNKTGYNVTDFGTNNDCISVDYPDYAKKVAKHVIENKNCFGILICNSGIGMDISANRFKGIRSVLCYSEEIAKLSREHNNANIICFGAAFIEQELAIRCVEIFAKTNLSDERHLVRINKIDANC